MQFPLKERSCDNGGWYPLTERLAPEISSIIREEISAFFAGVGSAEDCAAKIQSRVSIWLADSHPAARFIFKKSTKNEKKRQKEAKK